MCEIPSEVELEPFDDTQERSAKLAASPKIKNRGAPSGVNVVVVGGPVHDGSAT
jgi:hypothetical protein